MKAIVRRKRGKIDVVELERPVPKKNEVLIKVHAATVIQGDVMILKVPSIMFPLMRLLSGYKGKKIQGTEYSGVVEAVGLEVTQFKPGDEVWGLTTKEKMGGQAEFTVVSSSGIISKKPSNVGHIEAVTLLVGPMTAIQLLSKRDIISRKKVMIYGASGSVGTFAVQVAKKHGATVTAVCSERNFNIVKELGADIVLDYKSQAFLDHSEEYDLVFDAVGKMKKADRKRLRKEGGGFISTWSSTKETTDSLKEIREMVESGQLKTYIDKLYTLDEAVEAYQYVRSGRKRGNVVLAIVDQ